VPATVLAALLLAVAGDAVASHSDSYFVVLSGDQTVVNGARACFRLEGPAHETTQLMARLRFPAGAPHGRLWIDAMASPAFDDPNEEFVFTVDRGTVHQLRLELDDPSVVSWLSVAVPRGDITQVPCPSYVPIDRDHPVDRGLRTVNQLEPHHDWLEQPIDDSRGGGVTVIPEGTRLSVRLGQTITTRTAYAGQTVWGRLDQDVWADGHLVLPEGTIVEGRVTESRDAGRFGRSMLSLAFDTLRTPDRRVITIASRVREVGPGSGGKQAGIIAGSALGGALLGKVLGGDDQDALLGAVVGGGIAAGSIGARRNEPVVLPEGTQVELEVERTVRAAG
jgi:hypothetical protein